MTFEGVDIYTNKPTKVEVRDGHIAHVSVLDDSARPSPTNYLSHSLVDTQVNGYRGHDYSGDSLCVDDIRAMVKDLAKAGTLRHVPTVITGSYENTLHNLHVISDAVANDPQLALHIPGIHLEGPHISPMDGARGAHSLRYVRKPDIAELEACQEAAQGLIKLVTLAPEMEGAQQYIRHAVGMGIRVAIGHSLASPEDVEQAVAAGATLSTHLGNGSPAMLPRLRNPIWTQLAQDELKASLIADGFHLPRTTLKVFARAKELERIILVSDVGALGGMPVGRYTWGDTPVEVFADGHLGVADTEYLAGAGHLLDHCISVFRAATGAPLLECIRLASSKPAAFLSIPQSAEGFRVGDRADIMCFEETPGALHVKKAALGQAVFTN